MAKYKLSQDLLELGAKWKIKLQEAELERAKEEPKWLQLYKLWRGIPPKLPRTQVGKRANIFVPFVFPVVMTIQAREMMYFMGTSANLTVEIAGANQKEEIRQLQLRAQNSMEYLLSQPYRFTRQYNINQDRLIYGYCPSKLMPAEDYTVFRTELIHPWTFLYDPGVREWCDVRWAAHYKVVPISYLEGKDPYIQEVVKAISEGDITLDKRYPHNPKKGILLTEVWDKETGKMFALVNQETVVRAPEDFPHNKFPYLLHIDNPESLRIPAIGESELAKWLQLEMNILRNQRLDNVSRMVHDRLLCPPGVNKYELQNSRQGAVVNWDGTTKPEPIPVNDATKNLEFIDITRLKDEMRWLTGVLPGTTGEMPTKRLTTPEVSTMNIGAGSRFWLREKVAEDHYWKPWSDGLMDFLQYAPDDFFAKCASMGNDWDDKLKPSDLKKYDVQIKPRMSEDIINDMRLRETVLTVLKISGIAWNDWVDRGKALDVFLDAFRDVPGIRQIFAKRPKEPETMEKQSSKLQDVLSTLRAQPGQEKLTTT